MKRIAFMVVILLAGLPHYSQTTDNPKGARTANPGEIRKVSLPVSGKYHEGEGTLTRDDGTLVVHHNEKVFTRGKTHLDNQNFEMVRGSEFFRQSCVEYSEWSEGRVDRQMVQYKANRPISKEYRKNHYHFPKPPEITRVWTTCLFNRFMCLYPYYTGWDIKFGSELGSISSFEAGDNAGTVQRVYGRVAEVYYSSEDNNYYLYLGERFPYQDLGVVIPRSVAGKMSGTPGEYFKNEDIWMVGLIDIRNDRAEIVIRDEEQLHTY